MYYISEKNSLLVYTLEIAISLNILDFNANLIFKVVNQQLFLPVQQLPVTLIKIDLEKSLKQSYI